MAGLSDANAPIWRNNRERLAVSRRAMYGRDPTLNDEDRAAIEARSAISSENNAALEALIGELLLGQPVRAAGAIGEAVQDPSIANFTNAGAQSALAAFRPLMAGKVVLGGLGAAAGADLFMSDANAQSKRKQASPSAVQEVTLPGVSPEQNQEYNALQQRLVAGNFSGRADRQAVQNRVEQLRKLSDDFAGGQNRSRQSEYDNSVRRAETARDTIMADRPKRFNETSVGQVYDKLGVIAPGVIAGGMGALTKAGAMAAGHSGKVAPIAVGGLTGGVAASYPLGHELMFAPAMNPEKMAYSAYARELPPEHPRRQEWTHYAQGLPDENPGRRAAANEFYDPIKAAERTGFGVAEGLLGGLAGSEAVGIATRPFRRGAASPRSTSAPTQTVDDLTRGATQPEQLPSLPADYRSYPSIPSEARGAVQQAFIADRALRGQGLPAKEGASAIKQSLANQGVNAPVTPNRVAATNAAVEQFVAAYGRLPTAAEFSRVFTNRTLAAPIAAFGSSAAMYDQDAFGGGF
jgi:hypothetical protein